MKWLFIFYIINGYLIVIRGNKESSFRNIDYKLLNNK